MSRVRGPSPVWVVGLWGAAGEPAKAPACCSRGRVARSEAAVLADRGHEP
jgi:hypothetical protein